MNNRQIIDAMHEGIPLRDTALVEDSSKILLAAEFPRQHSGFKQFAKDRPDLALTPEHQEKFRTIVDTATELRSLHHELINATRDVFHEPIRQYMRTLVAGNKAADTVTEFDGFNQLHWERLQIIHPDHPRDIEQRLAGYSETARHRHAMLEIIGGGIGNAAWFSWSLICVTGKVLLRETGDIPTEKIWDTISQSTLSLMIDISSAERHVFDSGIVPEISRACDRPGLETSRDSDRFNWTAFDDSHFYTENGELMLDAKLVGKVRQEMAARVARGEITLDVSRTGCPGKIFFPRIHDWCLQAAREFVFPRAEHVLSLQ